MDRLDVACWAGCVVGMLAWVAWIVNGTDRGPTRPASITVRRG